MKITRLVVLAVLVFGAVACAAKSQGAGVTTTAPTTTSPPPGESAESALRRQTLELSRGQYGPLWDEMVPAQQALVTRDRFIECRSQSTTSGQTVTIDKVLTTYVETVGIPGTSVSLPSTALTVNLAVVAGTSKQVATTTVHEFAIAGQWHWNLDVASADTYKVGVCPP